MIRDRLEALPSWAWLAAGVLLIAAISLISIGTSSGDRPLDAGNAQPDGGLAMRLWLERIGYDVRVTADEPNPAGIPASGSLMLLASGSDTSSDHVRALLDWTRRGGTLVVATEGDTGSNVLGALGDGVESLSHDENVRVIQPLLLSPPAASLTGSSGAIISGSPADVEVARSDSGPALTRRQLGRGTVWLLSAPGLLNNSHIGLGENRRMLLNLAGPIGATVTLDQFEPSSAVTNGDWIFTSVWGAALLFAVAAIVLYRWLSGWRLGPAVDPLRERHRVATEYVVSLAGLLRRGRHREAVLQSYQQMLQRAARARYGDVEAPAIDPELLDRLRESLRPATRLSEDDLVSRAAAIVVEEEEIRTGRV